jgi:aspartate dehydrogenase
MRRLGIIGAGGMTQTVLSALSALRLDHLAVLTRTANPAIAAPFAATVSTHTELADFFATHPEIVAECAGHAAVRAHGAAVLARGCDLIVISVGALADDALLVSLQDAATSGGSRLILPAGAVGGLDALSAAKLSGLYEVTYTGSKPPSAWRGTKAERAVDLATLTEPVCFFEGSARDAARDYPQNANVAAAIALAGAGFDATRVRLVADPGISRNRHDIAVRSAASDFSIRLEGIASPTNPKTSLMAGYSVAQAVLNRAATLVI